MLAVTDLNVAQNVGFGIIAAFMIVFALNVVRSSNVVHAALSLVAVMAPPPRVRNCAADLNRLPGRPDGARTPRAADQASAGDRAGGRREPRSPRTRHRNGGCDLGHSAAAVGRVGVRREQQWQSRAKVVFPGSTQGLVGQRRALWVCHRHGAVLRVRPRGLVPHTRKLRSTMAWRHGERPS